MDTHCIFRDICNLLAAPEDVPTITLLGPFQRNVELAGLTRACMPCSHHSRRPLDNHRGIECVSTSIFQTQQCGSSDDVWSPACQVSLLRKVLALGKLNKLDKLIETKHGVLLHSYYLCLPGEAVQASTTANKTTKAKSGAPECAPHVQYKRITFDDMRVITTHNLAPDRLPQSLSTISRVHACHISVTPAKRRLVQCEPVVSKHAGS